MEDLAYNSKSSFNLQELNGDSRRGYEISAWFGGSMTAKQALNQWTGSQVILIQSYKFCKL